MTMICRNCGLETGDKVLCDLGAQPLANNFVSDPEGYEPRYPLAPIICKNLHCQLVQLAPVPESPFTAAYPYRSGQSVTWKRHLADLVRHVAPRLDRSGVFPPLVVEVGGNDGTLGSILPAMCEYRNIDPTADPKKYGTIPRFLTRELGEHIGPHADWVVANNVMAHVPDLDDFLAGVRALMRPGALLTVEVPDLNLLIENGAWDTVYHEHYSYFNRQTAMDVLERRGFFVSHTEDIPTHGGSIRLYAHRNELIDHPLHDTPLRIMKSLPKFREVDALFAQSALLNGWMGRKRVVGYGAPAKASTFLNAFHCDARHIEYIVDSTPEKIGRYTPGTHIPIIGPHDGETGRSVIARDRIDVVIILAWNYAAEILPKIPSGPEVWARAERLR